MIMASGDRSLRDILSELRSTEISVGEKHRRVNEIVKLSRSKESFKSVIELISPSDYFSRKVCVQIAVALQNVGYIVDGLKNEETLLLRQTLKRQSWLYHPSSALANVEFLINELFPLVSFAARQTILANLSKYLGNEERSEKIYEAVGSKYGFGNTGDLIAGCSPDFITRAIEVEGIQLSNRQLKPLLNKCPQLVIDYLKRVYRTRGMRNTGIYNPTLQNLVLINPIAFMDIVEEYELSAYPPLKLTGKASGRLLKAQRARIMEGPKVYTNFLDKKEAYKILEHGEYVTLFMSVLPKSVQEFQLLKDHSSIDQLIEDWLAPIKKVIEQGEMLEAAFFQKYGTQLAENELCISTGILRLLPPHERTKIVETENFKQYYARIFGTSPRDVAFKSIDKSIPELKALISGESDAGMRAELIYSLVETCSINHDKAALGEVCNYYVTRHRNERAEFHSRFIFRIHSCIDLLEFKAEHWASFFSVIKLFFVYHTEGTYYDNDWNTIIQKLYIFQVKNPAESAKIDSGAMLSRLIKMKVRGSQHYFCQFWDVDSIHKHRVSVKGFFDIVMKELENYYSMKKGKKLKFGRELEIHEVVNNIVLCFRDWNQKKPFSQERISVKNFPWLEAQVENILKNPGDLDNVDTLVEFLVSDPLLKKDKESFKKYLEISPVEPVILYLLRNDPITVLSKWEGVSTNLLEMNYLSLAPVTLIKNNAFTQLSNILLDKCESIVRDHTASELARGNAVTVLSILQDSDKFLKWIPEYFPKGPVIDPGNEEENVNRCVQVRIPASLKNIENASQGLPSLLKFCCGDYLKFSLGSMYALCCNAGHQRASEFLRELVQYPVSVQKHAIRLICLISTLQDTCTFIEDLWKSVKHGTIRHVVLKKLYNNAATWPTLKTAILSLNTKEEDSLKELFEMENVGKIKGSGLLEEYIRIVWKLFHDLNVKEVHKESLVSTISAVRYTLPKTYIEEFIRANLFNDQLEPSIQHAVITLYVENLLESSTAMIEINFEILEHCLQNLYASKGCALEVEKSMRNQKFLSYFVDKIIDKPLRDTRGKSDYSDDYLTDLFQGLACLSFFNKNPRQTLGVHLNLQLAATFQVLKNTGLDGAGEQFGTLLDTFIEVNGKECVTLFKTQLDSFLNTVWDNGNEIEILKVITGILKSASSNSTEKKIVALHLVPISRPTPYTVEKYKSLVQNMLQSDDAVVQAYAYNWLQISSWV